MVVFLTSSPTGPLDGARKVDGFDKKNNFFENLKKYWPEHARCLMISAFPHDDGANDEMRGFFGGTVVREGLSCSAFDLWDHRTVNFSREALHSYDVVWLGGGHVPTEHMFFEQIALREKLQGFEGMVIGISAGTMNSAKLVYAQPELAGESCDPNYVRFFEGLGLTNTNILPHYQMVKDWYLDGRRLFEDITYADSVGREFLVLPDGSYLLIENGEEWVFGEAFVIWDGQIRKICEDNQVCRWR